MKVSKGVAKLVVKGDWEGLQEKAKDGLAKGSTALKQLRAERTDGFNEKVRSQYEILTSVQACSTEVLDSLKREAERAGKSAKSCSALGEALSNAASSLHQISQLDEHSARSTAISNHWTLLATELEVLVAKGKHVRTAPCL